MGPIWLSHHHAEDAERCVVIGTRHVCRRCLATWPLATLTIVAGLGLPLPPARPDELALWLLPAALEYVAVHMGWWSYRPGRTWLTGLLLGAGLGRLFHRYLLDPADPVAWTALALLGLSCGGAALYHFTLKNRLL